jgi:endonuclease YncB( thermonuclease family)
MIGDPISACYIRVLTKMLLARSHIRKCALISALLFASALAGSPAVAGSAGIYWSDADSGVLNGQRFRLYGVDAPETGPVGWGSGAKCELERKRGYEAKAKMKEMTRGAEMRITQSFGYDNSEKPRLLVDLSANGVDVAGSGVQAGILAPWPHKGTKKLAPKPDWCR